MWVFYTGSANLFLCLHLVFAFVLKYSSFMLFSSYFQFQYEANL